MQPLISEVQRGSERIDNMMIEVAHEREVLHWREMMLLLSFLLASAVTQRLVARIYAGGD